MLSWMYMVDNNYYYNLVNLLGSQNNLKKYGRTYLNIVQCTLYVASSVRGGGEGGGGAGVGWWGICLTWLEKQSVMMNSFHQTE